MRITAIICSIFLFISQLATAEVVTPEDKLAPTEVIKLAIDDLLATVNTDLDGYKSDESRMAALIDEKLMPHTDMITMSRKVMGLHWRNDMDKAQKKAFIQAFSKSLVRYALRAFQYYNGQKLKILNAPDSNAREVLVQTRIMQESAKDISLDFKLKRHPKTKEWKVIDLVIDGISLVQSKKSEFSQVVTNEGIDKLITFLNTKELNSNDASAKTE